MTPTPRPPWCSVDVASTTTTTAQRRGGPNRGVVTFAAEADRNDQEGEERDGGTTTTIQRFRGHWQRSTPRRKEPPVQQPPNEPTGRRPWLDTTMTAAAPGGGESFLDDMMDSDAILTPREAAAAISAARRLTPRTILSSSFSSSSAPRSTSKLWHEETIDEDEEMMVRLWDEPCVVAQYVQGQLLRVQGNLLLRDRQDDRHVEASHDAVNKSNNSAEGFRRYVELLRSLQVIQAQQVGALLDRAPPGKEDVAAAELGTEQKVGGDDVATGEAAGRHPAPRGDVRRPPSSLFHQHTPSHQMEESTALPREGTQENDDKEDEKKEEDERPVEGPRARAALGPAQSQSSRRGMEATDANEAAATESTNFAAPTEDSLVVAAQAPAPESEWQVQQHQQQQQATVSRFGFVRLSTLEEVEYESDRTTPSAAASAAAATPTMTTATTTPATKTPPSSSFTLRRSSARYVEAPSDEMDSQMWEHESNRTLDTYDDNDDDTFERLYGTSGPSPAPSRTTRRGAAGGAGSRTSDDQGEDDEDEEEYDSALDCATLIASHRERRTSRTVLGPSSPQNEDQPRHGPSAAAAAAAVHATPSSAFRNKVVVVDYSENQPSPTMTNITMDEDMFDAVEKVENDDDGIDVGTQSNNKQAVQAINDSFPGANRDQHQSTSGREDEEDDSATMTSQETPVLERYRIDLDDESPHGFTVIPNPRRSRRGTKLSGDTPVDTVTESSARSPSQQPTGVSLLEKASTAFTSEELQAAENDWLASPNVAHSGRRRSVRKALRKSPYKLPKMVPTTPTIDENAPLALPGDVGASSSADRNRHRDESTALLDSGRRLRATLAASPATRLYGGPKEPLVKFKSTPSTPGSGASTLLYANAQLVLRDTKQLNQSHRSFDYNEFRGVEASPREGKGQAAAVVIPALTEAEYNSSRCIARSGITLEEAQRAIAALNVVLRDRAAVAATPPSRGRPGPIVGSGDRSVLRSSPYLKNRRDAAGAASLSPASPRQHFREHEAKRILMQALNITDRKSKTILVGLCHWRRLVLRRQSFGGGGGSSLGGVGGTRSPGWGGVGGNNNDDDNASTSSSTTLSLLLYEVPAAKPREAVSLI